MNASRLVFCQKLQKEAPGLPFKPFSNELGQEIYEHISMEAWQMWLRESPRYVNTYNIDLKSAEGRAFMEKQMRLFFGFDAGDMAETAWRPRGHGEE